MINLLPPKEKEELLLEKNKKLAIVLGNMALVSLVCLSLILFAFKFYLLKNASYEKVILGISEKGYQTPDFLSFKEIIQKYNSKIIKANNFYGQQVYLSLMLKDILKIERPNGLYLTKVEIYNLEKDGKIKAGLLGKSDTRDNLLVFKGNLESSDKIKNVYFPPNNWIKSQDVNFYATFEVLTPTPNEL